MLYQYQAHSLKKLAQAFSESVRGNRDPLQPIWIVAQNNEIKEWLSLQNAKNNGIFANAKFIYPSEFIWTLYRLKRNDIPKNLPDNRIPLQWMLFRLFLEQPELLEVVPVFPATRSDQRTIFQFCSQLADVFDQYQVYRPEMTEKWLLNEYFTDLEDEKWQAKIWRSLNEIWKRSDATATIPRRSEIITELKEWIKHGETLHNVPSEIYVFGLAQQSATFFEILTALSAKTNIHYFDGRFPSFSDDFQSIAENWAEPKQRQTDLLHQLLEKERAQVEHYHLVENQYQFPEMKIHSCHNKSREVEVLKDQILTFLEENPDKHPQDILVLVPDMADYSALAESVFSREKGEPDIPVSKLSYKLQSYATQAIVLLLDLLGSSYKASDVLQLLSSEIVCGKFDLSETELSFIEKWVQDNQIFWGLGEKPDSLYSWARGVNQLMAGFAMEAQITELYNGIIPYAEITSGEQIQCASKLSHFIYALKDADREVQKLKNPDEWLHFIQYLIQHFISDGNAHIYDKINLLKALDNLMNQIELAGFKDEIPFNLVKNWIIAQLDAPSSASGRFGQGITLSTYIPYRAVPFSFIGMLGMNEGEFPRQSVRPDYDLITHQSQPGDRILKKDDSLLFLETILAAEDHLHISFIGRESKANNKKLPSILVQQLLDYSVNDSSNLLVEHSLHSFNKMNFNKDIFSFSNESAKIATIIESQNNGEKRIIGNDFIFDPIADLDFISIRDFNNFFQNPAKYFVRNVLNASSYSDIKTLTDRELFKLDGLDNYKLNQDLFHHFLAEKKEDEIHDLMAALVKIPEGYAGTLTFEQAKNKIFSLIDELKKYLTDDQKTIEIETQVGDVILKGTISGVYGKKLISYRAASLKGKYLAEHFLNHLLLLKAGEAIDESYFISSNKGEIDIKYFNSENLETAVLEDYMNWFAQKENWSDKIKLFSESSKAYAEKIHGGKSETDAQNEAERKWYDSFRELGDYTDPNIQLLWDANGTLDAAFARNALRFWSPILEVMESAKGEKQHA